MRIYWVRKNLAFGSAITTWGDVDETQRLGFTHVINLLKNRHCRKIRQFNSLWLSFRDDKKKRPKWFYRKALKFHQEAARRKYAKLLVMCHHGRCRSASLTLFLLRSEGIKLEAAKFKVLKARPTAKIIRAYRESGEKFLRGELKPC